MRVSLRGLTSFGLSVLLVAPMLVDAGCASHKQDALNNAISTLSSNGVGIYSDTTSKGPMQTVGGTTSAMRLTRWQLANMVAQNDAGMGMLGAEIDRFEGPTAPKGAPTISMFIAGWMTRGGTPLSTYARTLMGARKYDIKNAPREVFPLLVVTLFIADIAPLKHSRHATTAQGFNFEQVIAQPAAAAGICSTVADFVSGVVADVHDNIVTSKDGFLETLWGYVVKAVKAAVSYALAPLMLLISTVSAGLAAITTVVSTLSPWTISFDAEPQSVTITDQPVVGKLIATVHGKSIDYPPDVSDCVSQLGGIDLSDINAKGADVTWTPYHGIPDHASPQKVQGVLGDDLKATYTYRTDPETRTLPKPECSSLRYVDYLGVKVSVARIDAIRAQQQLLKLAFSKLPTFVNNHLMPFFEDWLRSAQTGIANILSSPGVGYGQASLFAQQPDPAKCTATPPPSESPSAEPSSDNTALVGDWACNTTVTVNNKELGPFSVSVQTAMTFEKNGTSTGTQWGGAAMAGHNIRNGPGTGASHTGSGAYTYDATDANSGTLHVDGKNLALKFSNPNAFTTQVASPVSHRTYDLSCKRN